MIQYRLFYRKVRIKLLRGIKTGSNKGFLGEITDDNVDYQNNLHAKKNYTYKSKRYFEGLKKTNDSNSLSSNSN